MTHDQAQHHIPAEQAARDLAGAPKVACAGIDLSRKLGDAVVAGDVLYQVHASYQSDLGFARQASSRFSAYTLGKASEVPHVFVEF